MSSLITIYDQYWFHLILLVNIITYGTFAHFNNIYQIISNILWKSIGDNKLAVNYLIKFVIKVLFMTPNYVTITITKFHTIWMFVLDI